MYPYTVGFLIWCLGFGFHALAEVESAEAVAPATECAETLDDDILLDPSDPVAREVRQILEVVWEALLKSPGSYETFYSKNSGATLWFNMYRKFFLDRLLGKRRGWSSRNLILAESPAEREWLEFMDRNRERILAWGKELTLGQGLRLRYGYDHLELVMPRSTFEGALHWQRKVRRRLVEPEDNTSPFVRLDLWALAFEEQVIVYMKAVGVDEGPATE